MLRGTPQAMLRSLVVVAVTVDLSGQLVNASVYRSNGDSEAEALGAAARRQRSGRRDGSNCVDSDGQRGMPRICATIRDSLTA
jgi:protein TonB